MDICHGLLARRLGLVLAVSVVLWFCGLGQPASAQTISSVRSFDGGVAPLFSLTGPGSLYLDNQGTQGFLYNPGNNFQSYSFRNPTTGQAWSGAVMTLGPQLSIGLIPRRQSSGFTHCPSRSSPTTTAVSRRAVDPPRRHSLVRTFRTQTVFRPLPPRGEQAPETQDPYGLKSMGLLGPTELSDNEF